MKTETEHEYVFGSSIESITGKDVLVYLNRLRSKPSVYALTLSGEHLVFPVKEVDKYLKRIDKLGKRILDLVLKFDPVNSVELLDMVVARFPNVRQLYMNYSREHPVEHAMVRWAQLADLSHMQFPFPMQYVVKSMQTHQFTPLTSMRNLRCQVTFFSDEYSHYASTLPVLFPNLTSLTAMCSTQVQKDIEANIRTVMPKLEYVKTIDTSAYPRDKTGGNDKFIVVDEEDDVDEYIDDKDDDDDC